MLGDLSADKLVALVQSQRRNLNEISFGKKKNMSALVLGDDFVCASSRSLVWY